MIATWNVGTPLAGKQYIIDGTLAGRTGQDLTDAIAAEVGFSPAKVVVNGTDVIVDGQTLMTLADGYVDNPVNNRVGRHMRRLMMIFAGDRRTVFRMALRACIRVCKYVLGLSKAQTQALVGQMYDTFTDANTDG